MIYATLKTLDTHMVLKESSSKSPHTSEHKVDLIELARRVGRSVFVR